MSALLRIQHATGMKRINVDGPNETLSSIKSKIYDQFKIPQSDQKLSLTPLSSPNFIDVPDSFVLSNLGLSNGAIIFLGSTSTKMSENVTNNVNTLPKKCLHGPGGKCLNCTGEVYQPGNNNAPKGKCLHGPQGRCLNCLETVKRSGKSKTPDSRGVCTHSIDSFCNNCIPLRNLKKSDERKILKDQNCKCKSKYEKCLFCLENRLECDSTFIPYSLHIERLKNRCPHDKGSLDQKTGFCNLCVPKPPTSFKLKKCNKHEPYPKGVCSLCMPPNAVIKLQNYRHCDEISVSDFASLSKFVRSWLQNPLKTKRALLIGKYEKVRPHNEGEPADKKMPLFKIRADIQAVYVPQAEGLKIEDYEVGIRTAQACGLDVVGIAVTSETLHDAKYGGKLLVRAKDVLLASKFQSFFSDGLENSRFVTMVIEKNERGEVEPKCYQMSDQCVELHKEDLLLSTDDPGLMSIAAPKHKAHFIPSVIYKNRALGKGQTFLPDEFLVPVVSLENPKPQLIFRHNDFPIENATPEDLRKYLIKTIEEDYVQKFSNFALLTWSQRLLGLQGTERLAMVVAGREEMGMDLAQKLDAVLADYFV